MKIKYLLLFFVLFALNIFPQNQKVLVAKIDGEIDLGLAPFVKRVVNTASSEKYDAVIFEINTFGGRVDAATQIKDAILESEVLTIAFINKRAISAGALIALSCKKITMASGSSIGATTVVDQTGAKVSEKYQSYMRSEMRATAEKNGRRKDIAEGMVDERVIVKGLVDSTQLITLTSNEALKYGIADSVVNSLTETAKAFGIENPKFVYVSSNWAEQFVRFLSNPIMSSLLIMVGLIGLYTEIKTPGWGLAGTAGLIALALFFGTSVILDLASMWEILLFLLGVILILVEVFFIPGFGIPGVLGITLMLGSIFFSLFNTDFIFDFSGLQMVIIQFAFTLFGVIILIALLLRYLPKSKRFGMFVLKAETSSESGYISNPDYHFLIDKKGITHTSLRPAGIIDIENKRYDVVTEGEFIETNKPVKVIKIEGVRIVVKEDL
ncbi:MAG: nodulation protein NfeD [Ignavibacteria bacterium]|nr:nodulation protein NfeD [Ignavibacteria bacterium]